MATTPRAAQKRRRPSRSARLPTNVQRHGAGFRAVIEVGGRRLKSQTVATVEEAERLRDSMRQWRPGTGTFTLDAAIDLLREDLRRKACSEGTGRFYESVFSLLLAAWDGGTPLVRIDARAIERWADIRRDVHKVSNSTVRKDLGVLRRIFRLAVRRRRDTGVPENPLEEIAMPQARPQRFGFLTESEVRVAVERIRACDGDPATPSASWDADVVLLLFLTGLRRAEVARLTLGDIDVFRGRLQVRGKCGDRVLPIVEPMRPVLSRLIAAADDDGHLIAARGVAATAREARIDRALRRWRVRFGIANLHPHALRHSFATWHVRSGTPPHVLRELLGHQTLQMTMRYYHADGTEAHAAMAKMARAFADPDTGEVEAAR